MILRRLVILAFALAFDVALCAQPTSPPRFITELRAGRAQHVVIYGTSLSKGGAWVPQLQASLDTAFPGLVKLTNSARGGQHSGWGAANVDAAVVALKPDAVFIEFAINDAVTRFDLSLDTVRRNLDTILDRVAAALPRCEVILQIMNPAVGKPEGDPSHRRNQDAYQQLYRDAAQRRGLLLIDHSVAWNRLLTEQGEAGFKKLVPDGVHPSAEGWRQIVMPTLLRTLALKPVAAVSSPRSRESALAAIAENAARADRAARPEAVQALLTALADTKTLSADDRLRWAWAAFILAERDAERRTLLELASQVPDVRARMLIASFREFPALRADYARADRAHTALVPKLAPETDPATGKRRSPREVFGANAFDAPFTADRWTDPDGWVGRWSDGAATLDVVAFPFRNFAGRLRPGAEASARTLAGLADGATLRLVGAGVEGRLVGGALVFTTPGEKARTLRRVPAGRTQFERRPPGARVLLDATTGLAQFRHASGAAGAWKQLPDGSIEIDPTKGSLFTRDTFGDVRVYLEFRHAYNSEGLGPRRGNSGLYLANAYELQLVDSFGEAPDEVSSGSVYHLAVPRVNACAAPLEWQSLEVEFRAARFDTAGRKTASARLTVWMNGVLIHDDVALPHPTAASLESARKLADPVGLQPLMLQSHGNILQFRHIWVLPNPPPAAR